MKPDVEGDSGVRFSLTQCRREVRLSMRLGDCKAVRFAALSNALMHTPQALQAAKLDPAASEEALRVPREENDRLRERLLELEMQTVDNLEVRPPFPSISPIKRHRTEIVVIY